MYASALADEPILVADTGGSSVDPNTGMIVGAYLIDITAARYRTSAEARGAFDRLTQFSSCLLNKASVQPGPSSTDWSTYENQSGIWILQVHRNIIAIQYLIPDAPQEAKI